MELLNAVSRLFAHDHWANEQTVKAIREASGSPRAIKLFAHIVAAEWLWLARLRQQPQKRAVWPEFTLADCERELLELGAAWRDYLAALTPAALDSSVAYTNSKGERWQNTIGDILLHVTLHSSYHRGQIATALRDSGDAPAYTDYIEAVRRGRVP